MDEIEPKFGEWLRGTYASESNPRRDGMYVRTIIRRGRMNPGKFYEVTDGNGAFWMYPAQSVERIAAALRSAQAAEWVRTFEGTVEDDRGFAIVLLPSKDFVDGSRVRVTLLSLPPRAAPSAEGVGRE